MAVGTIRTTVAKAGRVEAGWHHVDATDRIVGRLATKIARVLMGKHRPIYTPHVDTGEFVVVTHVERLRVTGKKKMDQRVYARYSKYPGGYKEETMRRLFERKPDRVLREAVRRMLPKNAIGRRMLTKLKCYSGDTHPHSAQQPVAWDF